MTEKDLGPNQNQDRPQEPTTHGYPARVVHTYTPLRSAEEDLNNIERGRLIEALTNQTAVTIADHESFLDQHHQS